MIDRLSRHRRALMDEKNRLQSRLQSGLHAVCPDLLDMLVQNRRILCKKGKG